VTLVWAKSDIPIAAEMENAVREAVRSQIPDVEEFKISMRAQGDSDDGRGVGLTTLLDHALQLRKLRQALPATRANTQDALFLYGARR